MGRPFKFLTFLTFPLWEAFFFCLSLSLSVAHPLSLSLLSTHYMQSFPPPPFFLSLSVSLSLSLSLAISRDHCPSLSLSLWGIHLNKSDLFFRRGGFNFLKYRLANFLWESICASSTQDFFSGIYLPNFDLYFFCWDSAYLSTTLVFL